MRERVLNLKPMLCFFTLVVVVCMLSWFFFIGSISLEKYYSNITMLCKKVPLDNYNLVGGMKTINVPDQAILKVFMYDLPPEFHFGLLGWKPDSSSKSVWPNVSIIDKIPAYAGGLNLQHSIEYWLTLDLLSSELRDRKSYSIATRVDDSREADIIFVPFFSSLSFNRFSKNGTDKILQDKLVRFLIVQEEWKRSSGHDHIIMAHHPNSMMYARVKLWPCIFVLADFGRYPPRVANVEKDVIAPYKHIIERSMNESSSFHDRTILLYFKGAIYRKDGGFVRQELFYLLKDEKDVHFSFGIGDETGIQNASKGMRTSKFCLNIAGDTPSSNRLFDSIASNCVPVIISDDIELPFEDVIDYSEFCIFIRTSDALRKDFVVNTIRAVNQERWSQMSKRLREVENYFEFQYPSQKGDAVQLIWQAIARKVPSVRFKLHRTHRFSRYKHEFTKPADLDHQIHN